MTDKILKTQSGQGFARLSAESWVKHFGTWNEALLQAGFDVNLPQNITVEELVNDLKDVARLLERTPTYNEYNR